MVQQTSVEWLWRWWMDNPFASYEQGVEAYRKAKEMHETEIVESFENGENNIDSDGCYIDKDASKKYYNETFNK
jgi:hypothetical protein